MGGVAEQDETTVVPALNRITIADVGPEDPIGRSRLDDVGDWCMPASETSEQFSCDVGVLAARRRIGHRKPVDLAETDVHDAEALAVAPALAHASRRCDRSRRCV